MKGSKTKPTVGDLRDSQTLTPPTDGKPAKAAGWPRLAISQLALARECGSDRENVKKWFWVIVGGESGPNRRPCSASWIMDIADQCKAAGVPCYIKQHDHLKPGQQGAIPDSYWSRKEMPK